MVVERNLSDLIESEIPNNCVLIFVGLSGSSKTFITEEISKVNGFQILRSDVIRPEVLEDEDIFDERVASDPERRRRVYEEMFRQAEVVLRAADKGLILDATFFNQELRFRAAELAEKAHRTFVIAECVCTEKKSLERILKRTKENYESNALTLEAYLNNKALFQPVDMKGFKKTFKTLPVIHLVIDTECDNPSDWKIKRIEKVDRKEGEENGN